jgi:glutamyl-tRNA synthetase
MTVRVRFAPSPTGDLHVGGLRSSLFDWLFARHHGGQFILRIEDTDRTRLTPGSLGAILDAHRWLGLDWDEGPAVGGDAGPYFQSEKVDIYQRAAQRLVEQGNAYRCYCTSERLDTLRAEQMRSGRPPGYDRRCRNLTLEQRTEEEAGGKPYVVRFAMPLDGKTVFHDAIRGEIVFEHARYDDHVLLKSDGFATYHLAAIVDDGEMKITHAFRAEEWLPSTPRHLLTFRALGYEPPIYAHLPVVVGKDRKKLSKRHGDTSVHQFVEKGYLPEAMLNFLGLIGWSLDDHTSIISREEFVKHFDLDRVVKSPGMFDHDKLDWFNQQYILAMPPDQFAKLAVEWLEKGLPPSVPRPVDRELVRRMAPETQTRVKRLDGIAPLTSYLFMPEPLEYDPSLILDRGKKEPLPPGEGDRILALWQSELAGWEQWNGEAISEGPMKELPARTGEKLGDLLAPLRVVLTGSKQSLPMHVNLELLGKERSLARIDHGRGLLQTIRG